MFWFIYSPGLHRERRKFLRTALKELSLIYTDQPGLLGPKVSFYYCFLFFMFLNLCIADYPKEIMRYFKTSTS